MPKRGNRWTERGEPTKEKTVNIIMIQRMEEIQMFWDRGKFIFPTAGELHYTILLVLLAWLVLGSCPSPAPCHPSIKKPINSRSSSGSHGPHQLCWADTEYYSPFVGNSWHQHEGSFTSGFCLIRFSRAFSQFLNTMIIKNHYKRRSGNRSHKLDCFQVLAVGGGGGHR